MSDRSGIGDFPEPLFYGGEVPAEAERLVRLAARFYAQTERAEGYLATALERFPEHTQVLVACYKFHFYKGNLPEALKIAARCRDFIAVKLGIPENFRDVTPQDASFDSFQSEPRFYLFTLKAIAYIQMRLTWFDEAERILEKLKILDPADRIGASVLRAIKDGIPAEDSAGETR